MLLLISWSTQHSIQFLTHVKNITHILKLIYFYFFSFFFVTFSRKPFLWAFMQFLNMVVFALGPLHIKLLMVKTYFRLILFTQIIDSLKTREISLLCLSCLSEIIERMALHNYSHNSCYNIGVCYLSVFFNLRWHSPFYWSAPPIFWLTLGVLPVLTLTPPRSANISIFWNFQQSNVIILRIVQFKIWINYINMGRLHIFRPVNINARMINVLALAS